MKGQLPGTLLLLICQPFACSERDGASNTSTVSVAVTPLTLPGVGDARYTLTVENSLGQEVWSKVITADRFGDGVGGVSYVGPCDAQASPNVVRLTLDELFDEAGVPLPAGSWVVPPELSQPVECLSNQDHRVVFDLTVARSANQGFFDIAVSFEDIFCSAKLDCVGQDGQPLDLLHEPGGERGPTIVIAFACTAGGSGATTVLQTSGFEVSCSDGTRFAPSPIGRPGNGPGAPPYFFGSGVYRGKELLAGYDKCYWNTAIGLDLEAIAAASPALDCTLEGRATASEGMWDGGRPPSSSLWPYIRWSVPVIEDGALACGRHALDSGDGVVSTVYSAPPHEQTDFAYSMACGQEPVKNVRLCTGTVPGYDVRVAFSESAEGLIVTAGNRSTPSALPLPAGYVLEGCCLDGCCY